MYVANNPEGARTLEIDREVNDLQDRLDGGAGADPIVFRVYPYLEPGQLAETVRRFQPDVLHFAAHGHDGCLVFAHPVNGHIEVDGIRLAALLGPPATRPKLIVVNACSSDVLATALAVAQGADFVIGTDASITNVGAREMAAALYQRLAGAATIGDAFEAAAAQLAVIDGGSVAVTLHPAGSIGRARLQRLVDPMRIVACFPVVDGWLKAGLVEPTKGFRPERPEIRFGVAGAPAAARQTVFFTDDATIVAPAGGSLAEVRSWIVEKQPMDTQIWLDDATERYGDMNWFASITTTDARILSARATTTQAIRRYYFEEGWHGPLPGAVGEVVARSIECLLNVRGDRRRRGRH